MKTNTPAMAGKTVFLLCALIAAFAAKSWAQPGYVPWVFKVAIGDYIAGRTGTGSAYANLPRAKEAANAFAGSQVYAFGVSSPSYEVFDSNATMKKLSETEVGSTHREYYEMIFYYGHGLTGRLELGEGRKRSSISETYGPFDLTSQPMGMGYTRWIYIRACSIFNYVFREATPVDAISIARDSSEIIARWPTLFSGGLQAVLGYISLAYDHSYPPGSEGSFWYKWNKTSTFFQAFIDAEVYAHDTFLGSADGLALGCLESDDGGDPQRSFCSKTYLQSSYDRGNGFIGGFPSYFVGRPRFGIPFP